MENGQKTSIKQLSYQFCWIQVTFLDILKNLHLFTFHQKGSENCRSVQLNGLKASMPYSRYVAHCSNLMWPPRRSSWWVTWAAVSLWTGHWNVWKFQAKGIKKMNKGCILFSSRPSQSARIPILVRSPQKTNAANAPEKWKKWWHWKTILFSLKWSQFQVTGSGKTDLWGIGPFEDVFPIERCVFFPSKTSSFCTLSSWANGHLYGRTWCKGTTGFPCGGWRVVKAWCCVFFSLILAIDKSIYIFGWTNILIVIGFLKGRRVQGRG